MVVVDKTASAGDLAIITHLNAFADIEFASRANEASIAQEYSRSRLINAIKVKIDVVLDPTAIPNQNLMRPSYVQ